MRSKRWYMKFPLDAYALGPVHFGKPVNEREVRAFARLFEGCERLPRGFQCWPASERSNSDNLEHLTR